jgi:hypothetical protein
MHDLAVGLRRAAVADDSVLARDIDFLDIRTMPQVFSSPLGVRTQPQRRVRLP